MWVRNIVTFTVFIVMSSIISAPALAQQTYGGNTSDLLGPILKGNRTEIIIGLKTGQLEDLLVSDPMLQLRGIRAKHRKGVEAMAFGEYPKAERAFKDVLIFKPRDASANYLLGLTKIALGKPQDAVRYLKKTVRYRSDFVYGHIVLGITFVAMGKANQAKQQLSWLEEKFKACAGTCPQALDLEQGKILLANELSNIKA